jgi:GNAT superfamily N-acetyltransferase
MYVRVRPLEISERSLLKTATLGNLNWNEDRFTLADVESRPEFAHYTRLRPERGDFGLVAENDAVVGVAWAVYLPADQPGFGFVDEEIPELSVWVHPDRRNEGIGHRLLRSMAAEARRRRISSLSLSVEAGNHARHLYASEGYVDQPAPGVMLWRDSGGE